MPYTYKVIKQTHHTTLNMATRARIGIQLSDDSILSVYHHWDGYPSWLGRILETHYNTKEKVSALIDGGNMSSAYTNCGWNNETRPESGPMYYTERGETLESNAPRLDSSLVEYADKDRGEEYHYVYRKVCGEYTWVCIDMNAFDYRKDPEVVSIPAGALAC